MSIVVIEFRFASTCYARFNGHMFFITNIIQNGFILGEHLQQFHQAKHFDQFE